MARRDRRGPSRSTIIVLVLASVTLLTIDFRSSDGSLDGVRNAVGGALSPIGDAVGFVTEPIGDAWSGATGYDELEAENDALRAELDELRAADLLVASELRELAELRALNDLVTTIDLDTTQARIVDDVVTDLERTMTIDKGSADGIVEGAPVVASGGLVGRVVEVDPTTSEVLLLSDLDSGVGVRLSRSGETAVVQGRGRRLPLTATLVDATTTVVPGESVVTSGIVGSRFPAGLLVGTVLSAEYDDLEGSLALEVLPAVDVDAITFVGVLEPATTVEAGG